MSSTIVRKANPSHQPRIRAILERLGFRFTAVENALWRAQNRNATLTLYRSGKLVIQSRSSGSLTEILFGTEQRKQERSLTKWIGTNHAGSGDFFGAITFAGVLFKKEYEEEIAEMGIKDTKNLTPAAYKMLVAQIKMLFPHSIVTVSPSKYNQAYERFGQLHRILGWGHAAVVEKLLEKEPCDHAVCHQFADEKYIREALGEKGRGINLIQRHRAQDNLAVAAAGILAREAYQDALQKLSKEYSISLPRGASSDVILAGRKFVAKNGREALRKVCKLHFQQPGRFWSDPGFKATPN